MKTKHDSSYEKITAEVLKAIKIWNKSLSILLIQGLFVLFEVFPQW